MHIVNRLYNAVAHGGKAMSDLSSLIDEVARLTSELKFTDHIGRHNRLISQQERLFQQIYAEPAKIEILRALLNHADPDVRLTTAWKCGWQQIMLEDAERTIRSLQAESGDIGSEAAEWLQSRQRMAEGIAQVPDAERQLSFPEPLKAWTEAELHRLIRNRFAAPRADDITALMRRAVRIWPCAYSGDPLGSRLGGLPMLLPRQRWISVDGEPLLFLGQINCAELYAAVGDTSLPRTGVLSFFGDHDEVHGCGPNLGGAVLYAAGVDRLKPKGPPLEDFEPHVQCALSFQESFELPDPKSSAVEELELTAAEEAVYSELIHEIDQRHEFDTDRSKLLGWPNLIQRDLAEDGFADVQPDDVLLMQIGSYHDGENWQDWGPGGLIYFTISEESLAEAKFEGAQMSAQCT